jgi:hypothetical protein
VKEKAKEVLSIEQIEITKNTIKTTLLKTFPSKEEYINNILNDSSKLTNDKIEYFYQKIQK